ncbi:MAG: DUF4250 domain-containing protein [Porcipelethomonas sp.]
MNLPDDPVMLMSFINTLLRDKYSSFDQLCEDYNIKADGIINKLSAIGYNYNEVQNQFK